MRRVYSGPELLRLDCMLPRYVNSSTGSTVLPSTVTGTGVGPKPRFWIFVFVQETRRPNLKASSSIGACTVLPSNGFHHGARQSQSRHQSRPTYVHGHRLRWRRRLTRNALILTKIIMPQNLSQIFHTEMVTHWLTTTVTAIRNTGTQSKWALTYIIVCCTFFKLSSCHFTFTSANNNNNLCLTGLFVRS